MIVASDEYMRENFSEHLGCGAAVPHQAAPQGGSSNLAGEPPTIFPGAEMVRVLNLRISADDAEAHLDEQAATILRSLAMDIEQRALWREAKAEEGWEQITHHWIRPLDDLVNGSRRKQVILESCVDPEGKSLWVRIGPKPRDPR